MDENRVTQKRQPWVDRSKDWGNASVICKNVKDSCCTFELRRGKEIFSLHIAERTWP